MPDPAQSTDTAPRQAWMGLLARAEPQRLAALWAAYGETPDHRMLRAPERGTVMVRGRAGATGAPFNLGEVSITRCSVALADGTVGHAYIQGRDAGHAQNAALIDALMQTRSAEALRAAVLVPLETHETQARAARAAKADATRVEFFTMVRGEG